MAPSASSSSTLLLTRKGATSTSPATITKHSFKGDGPIPYLDLSQPSSLSYTHFKLSDQENEHAKFVAAFDELSTRVANLLACEAEEGYSETLQACRLSLQSRVPYVLQQVKQLIDSQESALVCKLRSSLAIFRAVQYVDLIQEGMDPETNEGLDQQLRTVLMGLDMSSFPKDFRKDLIFRVSPWVPSALCFDLPLGESAYATCANNAFEVQVEPVVEFRANDRASLSIAHHAAQACRTTVERVSHTRREFLGAGVVGEATVRVHVSPLDDDTSATKSVLPAWDKGNGDTKTLSVRIQEARVIQLNAFPPKPKATVDIYTSYVYGDAGVTVTMVMKTYATKEVKETPKIHIELFMAPPQPV